MMGEYQPLTSVSRWKHIDRLIRVEIEPWYARRLSTSHQQLDIDAINDDSCCYDWCIRRPQHEHNREYH